MAKEMNVHFSPVIKKQIVQRQQHSGAQVWYEYESTLPWESSLVRLLSDQPY